MSKEVTCPKCNGSGAITVPGDMPFTHKEIVCPRCDRKGTVTVGK